MTSDTSRTALQLRSLVKSEGELELSLASIPIPEPGPDEVLIRVEATPINPSDLGLLFGAAEMGSARQSGTNERPIVTASIPAALMKAMAGRVDQSMPVGNEGAGVVVEAGTTVAAQQLMGRTVAVLAGEMYSQYRCVKTGQCLPLPAGTTAAEGAACFVNPLTALGMVETMRREGHTALVHTAAASNLGQMLNRLCIQDRIGLVNIVRSEQQEQVLREQGAKYVCNSSAPTFMRDLTDAIGGGPLAGQILSCMEAALMRLAGEYQRYGSTTHKQVYIYGMLDTGPTQFKRNFGAAWGVGGWLLMPFLQKIGAEAAQALAPPARST